MSDHLQRLEEACARAETEYPQLAAPEGTVAVQIADLRDGLAAIADLQRQLAERESAIERLQKGFDRTHENWTSQCHRNKQLGDANRAMRLTLSSIAHGCEGRIDTDSLPAEMAMVALNHADLIEGSDTAFTKLAERDAVQGDLVEVAMDAIGQDDCPNPSIRKRLAERVIAAIGPAIRADERALNYRTFTDGLEAGAQICGSLAETTYDDADGFEAATGCEAAIMAVVRTQRKEHAAIDKAGAHDDDQPT